jgi:hypothetical protein
VKIVKVKVITFSSIYAFFSSKSNIAHKPGYHYETQHDVYDKDSALVINAAFAA